MWVGYTGGDQISFTPQKQTQPVSSVCCASPESNCCPETNLPAHARWSKPLPRLSFILPLTSFLLLLFLSFSTYKEDIWGVLKREKGSLPPEFMLWISLDWHGSWQKTGGGRAGREL